MSNASKRLAFSIKNILKKNAITTHGNFFVDLGFSFYHNHTYNSFNFGKLQFFIIWHLLAIALRIGPALQVKSLVVLLEIFFYGSRAIVFLNINGIAAINTCGRIAKKYIPA